MTIKLLQWEPVIHLLQNMAASLEELSELLAEEEQAVKMLNREKMLDLLEKKEGVLDVLQGFEQKIIAMLHHWVPSKNFQASKHFIANAGTSEADPARDLLEQMGELLRPIQEQSRKNEGLIRRGQYVVREALTIVAAGLGKSPVYQETGTLRDHDLPGSVNLQG